MQVESGQTITSTLIDPAGNYPQLGARVEVPITGAIASPWQYATKDAQGVTWTVNLDPITTPDDYLLYWMTPDSPATYRQAIPLTITPTAVEGPGTVPDFPPLDPASITPTVQEVADLERTRTIDDTPTDLTNFDATTRPTDVEVQRLIDHGVQAVAGSLRPAFPTAYYDDAKYAVCLYTAILIEGSYFREQVNTEGAMSTWRALYADAISNLQSSIEYDLRQWRLMQRIEPPFTPRREPWQQVGWNPGAIA